MKRVGAWSNEEGAIAPTVALSLVALIAVAGVAIDYARIASLDTEIQNAADQAALAAAAQLDKEAGSTARATASAEELLDNITLLSNDGAAADRAIEIVETIFYKSKQQAVADNGVVCPATDIGGTEVADDVAAYVCVRTATRASKFALTPIVAALQGNASAMAVATLERATCKTPPLMICNPNPGADFVTSVPRGTGIRVTGHGNSKACQGKSDGTIVVDPDTGETVTCEQNVSAWAAGDFGFLKVGSGSNAELIEALAFQFLAYNCTTDDGQEVNPGNPQGLYEAINTRFDIYDFSTGNGTTLAPCHSGACPAALNAVKDLVNNSLAGPPGSHKCGLANGASGNGWDLPTKPYWPADMSATTYDPGASTHDYSVHDSIEVMGFPRDLCHYNSSKISCGGSYPLKIGNGKWGRHDYWTVNHGLVSKPKDYDSMTRYDVYIWELANGLASGSGQYASPQCSTGTVSPGIDRRVLTVAIVNNCTAAYTDSAGKVWPRLTGTSQDAQIGEYVDMFLVEPIVDGSGGRGNGDVKDSIYMEYIGVSPSGANGLQAVVKEVPLIVK